MQKTKKLPPLPQSGDLNSRLITGFPLHRKLFLFSAVFLFLTGVVLSASPTVRSGELSDFRWQHWLGYTVWLLSFFLVQYFTLTKVGKTDPLLISLTGLLVGWGLLSIWRIDPYFGLRQTIWVAVAALIYILGLQLPSGLGFLRKYKYLLLVSGLALMGLTLVFGTNPMGGGPKLWLNFWGVYLQPSEPLKLIL